MLSTARPQQKPASGRIKASWETGGLSLASPPRASAFRLRVSIWLVPGFWTAMSSYNLLRQGLLPPEANVGAAARPSWTALTICALMSPIRRHDVDRNHVSQHFEQFSAETTMPEQ
jgi:hypothetical protein